MFRDKKVWSMFVAGALVCGTLHVGTARAAAPANTVPVAQAENWCAEAESSLSDASGKAIRCQAVAKRCVRMNNYWCQKHGDDPWMGTANKVGSAGSRDVDGHAIFESAAWSARAIARDLRSKHQRNIRTALDLAEAYSPWCDTKGSKAVSKAGSGRTCRDGAQPPKYFKGPFCSAPSEQRGSSSTCTKGCNCPPEIAQALVRDLGIGIHDELNLFDKAGRPTLSLAKVIRNLAIQEQGIHVRPSVIKRGIEMSLK